MAEYIGSRISLISKRDIRYVGTLHEISSENSTVALEQVKSFGTEGRDTENEIPPSENVYEYIVFRGSDVKDLRIEKEPEKKTVQQPQVPDDPAILGQARPAHSTSAPAQPQNQHAPQPPPVGPPRTQPQFQNHQHFPSQQNRAQGPGRFNQPPNFPYQYPNQRFGPQPPQGYPPYGYPAPYGSPPPGWFPQSGQGFPLPPPDQFYQPPRPFGAPGQPPGQPVQQSKPQTPAESTSREEQVSAAAQQPIEKPAASVKLPTPPTAAGLAPDGPPPPTDSKPDIAAALAPPAPTIAKENAEPAAQVSNGQRSGRIMPAIPKMSPAVKAKTPIGGDTLPSNATNGSTAQNLAASIPAQIPVKSPEDATRDARAAVAAAMAKLAPAPDQASTKQINGESAIDNLTNKVNEMRTHNNIRSSRQPGTGGYAAGHRGGRSSHRGGRARDEQGTKKIEVPTTDYDFASANAKFNKQELVKEVIASGSPIDSPIDGANNAPPDTSADGDRRESEASVTIPAAAGYNKSSSFFDNISSESRDRDDKKLGGREFRNEERSKNFETFGQGSVDNGYRGGLRGRGRGRGYRRGPRGGYRGTPRGRGSR
ncbi:hypothetical protein ACLMJK_002138 [Lecanora helva]